MIHKKDLLFLSLLILSCVPFLLLFRNVEQFGFLIVAANVSGFFAALILWWQFAFGIRPVSTLFTDDHQSLVRWHIFLGTYGVLFLALHPVLEFFVYKNSGLIGIVPDVSNPFTAGVAFGQFALVLFLFVWISSALIRKMLPYRTWRVMHYVTYPATVLIFFHAKAIGTFLNSAPALSTYWTVLSVLFVGFVLWRIVFLFVQPSYEVVQIKHHDGEIAVFTLKPKGKEIRTAKSGQYVYVKMKPLGEAHPFSVMRFDPASRLLYLGIKASGPFTKKLHKIQVGSQLQVSGPLGRFTREASDASLEVPRIFIAGGIGITPFVEHVESSTHPSDVLIYCTRTQEQALFRDQFKDALQDRYIEILSAQESVDPPARKGYLSKEILESTLPKSVLQSALFFVCGPPVMMEAVEKLLTELQVQKERIHMEKFSL